VCRCLLHNKSEAELYKLGECPLDPGGYFIVRVSWWRHLLYGRFDMLFYGLKSFHRGKQSAVLP
jgi:hypothetical protein